MPPTFRSLGDFQLLADHDDRVVATASRGAIEIAPAPGGTLRVRLSRRKRLPAYHSLAVAPSPVSRVSGRTARKRGRGFSVVNENLAAQLQFDPLALSFSFKRGPAFAVDVAMGVRGEQIVVRKALNPGEHIYGLGEKTGWLDKRGRKYKMRNSDVWLEHPAGFGNATDPLYASFPVFLVHSAKGSYGIFVDNPEFAEFDFTGDDWYEFSAPADALNYYVLPGPTLPDVLRQYTGLTGRMPLPALWTLGYHQCRWSYASEAEVRRIAAELRKRNIPADGIWLDIDYMDGYRVFTWDKKRFPRPRQLAADLSADGFHPITIVDPGVKVDEGYTIYDEGRAGDHFVKHSNGDEYNGSVWPGRSAFPDFHRAETRAWWAGRTRQWLADYGLSAIWNDMNEPASTDLTGPILDALHDGGKLPHASARNTYALQMARATYDGMLQHDPDSRPFILTRAAFSGAQTVTALWCGDNHSHWEHLAASLPMLMNLGVSGMPFVGVDIGGFGGDSNGELLARWTQAGAFYPFCRNHAATGTRAQEPWTFGPEVEAICRKYLSLRYQLLPYLYNLFYEASQTGAPIMRPLAWHYPKDPATFNLNDQFMLGPDLFIAPILAPGLTARAVYLPKGRWYRWRPTSALSGAERSGAQSKPVLSEAEGDAAPHRKHPSTSFHSAQDACDGPTHIIAEAPLDEMPIFVRAGAIIPTWPPAQHTGAIDRGAVTLHIWPGQGALDFYEDDGATRGGGHCLTRFKVTADSSGVAVHWGKPKGVRPARSSLRFTFHGLNVATARLDGQPVAVRRNTVQVEDDGQKHELALK
jgi:alpha-glucosidase